MIKSCPICNSSQCHALFSFSCNELIQSHPEYPYHLIFKPDNIEQHIYRCSSCSHNFYAPVPNAQSLGRFYDDIQHSQSTYYQFARSHGDLFANIYLQRLLSHFKSEGQSYSNKKLLDVGCSYGAFLKSCERAGFDIYGIDLSSEAIDCCRRDLGFSNVIHGDFMSADYPENSFDVVSSFGTLEHIVSPIEFIKKVRRVLVPGGIFFVSTLNYRECLWTLASTLARVSDYARVFLFGKMIGPHHLQYFSKESYITLLEKASFQSSRITFVDEPANAIPHLTWLSKMAIPLLNLNNKIFGTGRGIVSIAVKD